MSYLVTIPEVRFSHDMAQIMNIKRTETAVKCIILMILLIGKCPHEVPDFGSPVSISVHEPFYYTELFLITFEVFQLI